MKILTFLNRTLAFCYYLLFLLVPLIFSGDTSELFEFNKMWFTFGLTSFIVLLWCTKMFIQKRFFIQRTPLDIPILLFLVSQTLSTIFSLDRYVSLWGYYSRFNGGLYSTITYILLYYAFVSNLGKKQVIRLLQVSLFSGLIVALWGLPSHFGYDPTCYVFRGNLDVSCWTNAFQPKVRIFSTLGQPDWMAAYMAVLIPIAIAFGLMKNHELQTKNRDKQKNIILITYYILLTLLFYVDLLFTKSRSGFIGIAIPLLLWLVYYLWAHKADFTRLTPKPYLMKHWYLVVMLVCILGISFFTGTSIQQLDKFSYSGLQALFASHSATNAPQTPSANSAPKPTKAIPAGEFGGTDSGKIRLFVWQGALKVWEHYPIFGTGVETFAFAYYLFRPIGHNLTSEWDYLYNKAHNEYLNYLATTGAVGLGAYLSIICVFFIFAVRHLNNQTTKLKSINNQVKSSDQSTPYYLLLTTGLLASFLTILITNFFGFSVVIINLYFFLIPASVLSLQETIRPARILSFPKIGTATYPTNMIIRPWQYGGIALGGIIVCFIWMTLFRYWIADKSYAYGSNLDHAGYYQQAHPYLQSAVEQKPQEPVFLDELSINDAILATAYAQKNATQAAQLAQQAVQLSDNVITNHPNNVVYWKTRVRIFYSLAELNQQYTPYAIQAVQKAHELAPTDAKITYNLGLLYAQTGDIQKGIQAMQEAIRLKPDYQDAYYALGLFYRQAAIDKNGNIINKGFEQKAVDEMHFVLDNFGQNNQEVLTQLKNWGEE